MIIHCFGTSSLISSIILINLNIFNILHLNFEHLYKLLLHFLGKVVLFAEGAG